jgi:predicted DNA-binding ribbon-helix-helix protein
MKSLVLSHSVTIDGQRTSIALEEAFWSALKHIAREGRQTLGHLITSIDADRKQPNLSSALRVFVLEYYRDQLDRRGGIVGRA